MLNKISILKNPVQEYAWGSKTAIQTLIGEPRPTTGRPIAELWMGAHPKAPSRLLVDGGWKSFKDVIDSDPECVLGKRVARKFSNKLPFLFKVLAADKPLSIQVHPNLEQAREGFAAENTRGIPLTAPNRRYRDENHKPEIFCALTPFLGLKGFRRIQEILDLMEKVSPLSLSDELGFLRKEPDAHGLKRFFTAVMNMDKSRQRLIVSEAARFAEKYADEAPAFEWIVELNGQYPGDIGALSPVILNLVQLEPGEAIYLQPGDLHAYLHGVGIELMANSDNVLRGGLTAKHIDASELLRIVNFNIDPVHVIESVSRGTCERVYPVPAEEFLLSVISVTRVDSFTSRRDRSVEILICINGEAGIKELGRGESLALTRGESVVVPAVVSRYQIEGSATLYRASVPLPPNPHEPSS